MRTHIICIRTDPNPKKHVQDHADCSASARQLDELDHAIRYTNQEHIYVLRKI